MLPFSGPLSHTYISTALHLRHHKSAIIPIQTLFCNKESILARFSQFKLSDHHNFVSRHQGNRVRKSQRVIDMESEKKPLSGTLESLVDYGFTVAYPYALRAAVLLKVPNIIQSAGPDAALSAKEICAHLANPERASSANLEKVLEILSCYGMLSCKVEGSETTRVRKYALTSLFQDLTVFDSLGGDWLVLMTSPELTQLWPNIHEAVLNPDEAVVEKIYGKGLYQYLTEDARELGKFHVKYMQRLSALQFELVLECYDEDFRSLTGTLVDVGGSQGGTAAIIASKFPNIKSVVNFDLPQVVSGAPAYRGVEHVGGSFLDFVPQGDMLFMKYVLLNWSDEELIKLLRNCCNALPAKGGKLIIVDKVKPDEMPDAMPEDKTVRLRTAVQDLLLGMVFKGGKQRDLKQHQVAAEAAGFASLRVVKWIDTLTIMEAIKA